MPPQCAFVVSKLTNAAAVARAKRALALLDTKAAAAQIELLELWRKLSVARYELSESHKLQLQEANQHLVLAALHADEIAESAVADLAELRLGIQRDVVTGTITRALMVDRVKSALLMARRYQRRLAVMFVDLNHFKQINDRLGHAAGDEALQIVARALQSVLSDSDTLCRYGGDDFLVLLTEILTSEDVRHIAAEMLAALRGPVSLGGQVITLSASLGISISPDDGEDVATLINHADAAMYRHKRAKLGEVQFHADGRFHESDLKSKRAIEQATDAPWDLSLDSPLP